MSRNSQSMLRAAREAVTQLKISCRQFADNLDAVRLEHESAEWSEMLIAMEEMLGCLATTKPVVDAFVISRRVALENTARKGELATAFAKKMEMWRHAQVAK